MPRASTKSDEYIKNLVEAVLKQCANDDSADSANSADNSMHETAFEHEFDLNDMVYIYIEPGNVLSGHVNGMTFDCFDGMREVTYHVNTHISKHHCWSCSEDEVFSTANEAMAASHAN